MRGAKGAEVCGTNDACGFHDAKYPSISDTHFEPAVDQPDK